MTDIFLSCCVCLKKDSTIPLTKCDLTNATIISKLQLIASEVEWESNYTICEECEAKLNIVVEFRNLCLESEQFRKNLDTKSLYESQSYVDWVDIKTDISDRETNLIECKTCNINFQSDEALNQHNVESHRLYSCFKCDNVFPLKSELEKHEKSQHDLVCKQCNEKFSTRVLLEEHIETHIGVFVCYHCGKGFENKSLLIQHITLVHVNSLSKRTRTCQYCDNVYINTTLLKDHIKNIHGIDTLVTKNKSYQCTKCEKSYVLEKVMVNHMTSCDGVERQPKINPNNKCNRCERCYKSRKLLKEHMKTCKDIKEKEMLASAEKVDNWVCSLCKLEFSGYMERQNHFLLEHKLDITADNFCFQQFDGSKDCKDHIALSHSSQVEEYINKEKTKSAKKSYSDLKCHKKEYDCDISPDKFNTDPHELIEHVNSSKWRHQCNLCDKKFLTISKYDLHMRRHLGIKTFTCPLCEKTFTSRYEQERHSMTHTDIREFNCTVCKKEYRQKYTLLLHLKKVHNIGTITLPVRERRHICEFCEKAFYEKSKLIRHSLTHLNKSKAQQSVQ